MRNLRVLLMLLLALLLPARGAVAAMMACEPASHAASSGGHHSAVNPDHPASHEHTGHQDVHSTAHVDAHDGAGANHDCTFCVSFSSLTPLLSSEPTLPILEVTALPFPGIVVPAASFLSGGQERPPRTI